MMDIKEDLLLWFINFFDKKSAGIGIVNNNNNNDDAKQNLELAEELHKPIIKKFKKGKFILDLKIIFEVLI